MPSNPATFSAAHQPQQQQELTIINGFNGKQGEPWSPYQARLPVLIGLYITIASRGRLTVPRGTNAVRMRTLIHLFSIAQPVTFDALHLMFSSAISVQPSSCCRELLKNVVHSAASLTRSQHLRNRECESTSMSDAQALIHIQSSRDKSRRKIPHMPRTATSPLLLHYSHTGCEKFPRSRARPSST